MHEALEAGTTRRSERCFELSEQLLRRVAGHGKCHGVKRITLVCSKKPQFRKPKMVKTLVQGRQEPCQFTPSGISR